MGVSGQTMLRREIIGKSVDCWGIKTFTEK